MSERMNAEQRRQIFEQLRYELRMAEGWADELNSTKASPSLKECEILMDKVQKAHATSQRLVQSFVPEPK